MPRSARTPAAWVQIAQAAVARELVDGFGLSDRRAAVLLGLVPSAVSQYRTGRRLGRELADLGADVRSGPLVRAAAERMTALAGASPQGFSIVLEAARALADLDPTARTAGGGEGRGGSSPDEGRRLARALRDRIAIEQAAVTECMRLAQKSRDELTRAVFRQIAADSLRHAEIVASIGTYLDRGLRGPMASGVSREDVVRLIERERDAESRGAEPGHRLGGVMAVLWESMDADERKHEVLLDRLLTLGFPSDDESLRSAERRGPRPG